MRTLVTVVAVGLLASSARAEGVKLKIKQTYEKTHGHVGVDALTRTFLAAAHLRINPRASTSLSVELDGQPTSHEYEDPLTRRRSERWINADVSGLVQVQRDGKELANEFFSGRTTDFPSSVQGRQFASRSQAPFEEAFEQSTFVAALADALEPVAGSDNVVRGLEAIARGKLAQPLRTRALCRLAGEPGAGGRLATLLRARKIAFEGDALKDLHDPQQLCLVASARLATGLANDDERAELARRYVSCLATGGWCGYESSMRGWCGDDAKRDLTLLRGIGQPAIDELLKVAKTSYDDMLLERVFERLGLLRAKEAVPIALERTKQSGHSYYRVRLAAVSALGAIGDPSASERLEELARTDPETLVSGAAETALKKIRAAGTPDAGAP